METRNIICYYVTGHGYGHATRVIGQVKYLLSRNYVVHIISSLDPEFFKANIITEENKDNRNYLYCHRRILDAGAVQLDPLHVDIQLSLSNYYQNIYSKYDELIENERQFLIDIQASVVLVDATPLPCSAAKAAGVPAVVVSNFTWDVTYRFLLDVIKPKLSDDEIMKFEAMVSQVSMDVCNAAYYLRLPGITPLPPLYQGKVIPGPMICRKANRTRNDVRRSLKIPESSYMLVLGFGGFKLSGAWALHDASLPSNWVCVVLGSEGDTMPSDRYITVPRDVYVPDLIAAADAVLGKLGYGTVSECLCHGTPLLYVPRVDWPEEEYLSRFIMNYSAGVCITEEEFLSGNWSPYLSLALERKGKWDVSDLNIHGAFDEVEMKINDIINRRI